MSTKTFPTLDPQIREVIANIAEGNAEKINRIMKSAKKAIYKGPWPKIIAYV